MPGDAGASSALAADGSSPLLDGAPQGPGADAQVDAPLDVPTACRHLATPQCADYQKCFPVTFARLYPDLASCVQATAAFCVQAYLSPGGTATANDVEACAAATATTPVVDCTAYYDSLGPSAARRPQCVFKGTLWDGAFCIDNGQCQSGRCAFFASDACGTCVTPDAPAPCMLDAECPPGFLCSQLQRCVQPDGLGAPCGEDSLCQSSLVCKNGACSARGSEGAPCDPKQYDCAFELWCNAVTGTCQRSTLSGLGQPCYVLVSGQLAWCKAGLQCAGSSQIPVCVPALRAGQPCTYGADCDVGLQCLEALCTTPSAGTCLNQALIPSGPYPAQTPSVPQLVPQSAPVVLTSPKVVAVTFAGDPNVGAIEAFVNALRSSDYWRATTAEYGIGPLIAVSPVRVQETPAASLSQTQIDQWLASHLGSSGWPVNDGSTIYAIFYPRSTTITDDFAGVSCVAFGGYHSWLMDSRGVETPYAVMPRCTVGPPTTSTSHELVESVTDPFSGPPTVTSATTGTGYSDVDDNHAAWRALAAGYAEAGDLCVYQPLAMYVDTQLGAQVQRTWSNAQMQGFHHPCAPAPGQAAYFAAVPELPDTIALGASRSTKGVTIPVGTSKTITLDMLSDGPVNGGWRVSAYDVDTWNGRRGPLSFRFDKQFGSNGDTIRMTITALTPNPGILPESFIVVSRRGRQTNFWLGSVDN